MRKILTAAAIAFVATVSAAGLPEGEFRNPSMANRPETYVFLIGGNVAKPGITADFEAIKDAGIAGILLFHGQLGSPWPGVSPQIKCLSKSWDGLMRFVADECRRLGLSLSIHNCPGWAMSGGPWIKPENAMRHLIWKRIDVEGGKRVEVKLPTLAPSAPDPRDCRDIAVLAFPATAGEWVGALKPAKVTSNDKGEWTTPDGVTYRILWVPESKRMMPETMEKILDGVKKGAKAAFAALPESISTLRGGTAMQARFDNAKNAMLELGRGTRPACPQSCGTHDPAGSIYEGRSLESVLANEKIAKDLVAEGLVWNHRRSYDADWYFVSPARQNEGFTGTVGFRCVGDVEIWHPETGLSEKGQVASVTDGHMWVSLALAPHESRFVVFKRGVKLNPCAVVSTTNDVMTLAGPWKVSFPEGWGMPGEMTIDELKPWKELGTTPEAKAFSGTADYTIDFTLDRVDADTIVLLDLGRVESLAKVEVNGMNVGNVWSQPYRIPLTGAVKAGKNTLKVSVTDTWYNRLVFDAGQPEAKRRTWTIAGPKKDSPLRDSGLIGPVRVIRYRLTRN